MDLLGKVVIVTGAHGGQGDAEARLVAARGGIAHGGALALAQAIFNEET